MTTNKKTNDKCHSQVLICSVILILVSGCSIINSFRFPPPTVFPMFEEKQILGPGTYLNSELQWSSDGRYIATIDNSNYLSSPVIYDLEEGRKIALDTIFSYEIAWHPENHLSYVDYIPSNPEKGVESHSNINITDLDGNNVETLVSGLKGMVFDFLWLSNGEEMIIVESDRVTAETTLFKVDVKRGIKEVLLTSDSLGGLMMNYIALSHNEEHLFLWVSEPDCFSSDENCVIISYLIYDFETLEMIVKMPDWPEKFDNLTLRKSGLYSTNTSWINNDWILTEGNALKSNQEPEKFLVFLNVWDLSKSFEILAEDSFGGPTISPDLKNLVFVNFNEGPHTYYITLAELQEELRLKLGMNK